MSANRAWLFIFIYEYPSYHFRGFFDGALSLYLARSHTNFRSHLPRIFFGIQIQFFPVSCTNNPVSLLRCHDGCRSFPSLYRKKRQSFTALFMDGNLPRPLGSRQLYLCRDLTPARFISGSSSALRAPDGRSHQRNFHLIIYNGRRLPHRLPGSRTFRPFSRNPLRHRQPSD